LVYRPHLRQMLGDVLLDLTVNGAEARVRSSAEELLAEYGFSSEAERKWMDDLPYTLGP